MLKQLKKETELSKELLNELEKLEKELKVLINSRYYVALAQK